MGWPLWWVDLWPAGELSRWLAYSQVEALPDAHWDAAMVARTVAAVMGGYKGGLDPFLPVVGEPKPLTYRQLKAKLIIALGAREAGHGRAEAE